MAAVFLSFLHFFLINEYVLIRESLLYIIVMVFAIHQHESATGIHVWYLCFLLCCLVVVMHLFFTQAAWLSVFQNLKHQSLFYCFSPNTSTDPQGVPWFLGVPSRDMKVRSWLACKATFKCVTHTYKPMRAWQLQFLMPACLWKEQSSTWSQCSRHVEKYLCVTRGWMFLETSCILGWS